MGSRYLVLLALFVRFSANAQTPCICWVEPDSSYTLIANDSMWTALLGINMQDDGCHGAVHLPFTYSFFGEPQDSLFIGVNGYVSFGTPLSMWGWSIPHTGGIRWLAPFRSDVDLTGPCTDCNKVYYKVSPTCVRINWVRVGYYDGHVDQLNSFQLTLTDGTDPALPEGMNTAFCYGDMQWTTSDALGANGFGNGPAHVGADRGDMSHYLLVGAFNQDSDTYDGPAGDPDGVHWLDSASVYMDLSQLTNAPSYTVIGPACEVMVPDISTSIRPELTPSLSVRPNPAHDRIMVDVSGMRSVEVLSLDGQLVKRIAVLAGAGGTSIDIRAMAPGTYFLRGCGTQGTVVHRFIKE